MRPGPPSGAGFLGVTIVGVAIIGVAATCLSISAYGWPVAGGLVDPDATLTNYGPPGSEAAAKGFGCPDWLAFADGQPLTAAPGEDRGATWDRVLAAKARRGEGSVRVGVVHDGRVVTVDLAIGKLDGPAWWVLGAAPIFAGWLLLLAGAAALGSPAGTRAARSCAGFSLAMGALAFTVLDYHTTRAFELVFEPALGATPFLLLEVALTVPDAPAWVERRAGVLRALDGLALAGAAFMALSRLLGADARTAGVVVAWVLACACLMTSVIVTVRFHVARGIRRRRFGALAGAFVAVPLLGGVAGLLVVLPATAAFAGHAVAWVVPLLFLMPSALLVAHVKNDLWHARAPLARPPAQLAVGVFALVCAIAVVMMSSTALGVPFRRVIVPAVASGVLSVAILRLSARSVGRWLFPELVDYRRFSETLTEALAEVREISALPPLVESALRRWIRCDEAEVGLWALGAVGRTAGGAARPHPALQARDHHRLRVPICVRAADVGFIEVGARLGGRAFSEADRQLVLAVAHQTALALAFISSYAELEAIRRIEAAAWKEERSSLLQTAAAEIAAEIRETSTFFRGFFGKRARAGAEGAAVRQGEVERAAAEVSRLEQLVTELARVTRPRTDRERVPVRELVERARALLQDSLVGRSVSVEVDGAAAVACDPEGASRIVVSLLANAAAATAGIRQPHIRIVWSSTPAGAQLRVGDNGVGFAGDVADLFSSWPRSDTRQAGLGPDLGVGLAIAQHIAAAHGWSIDASRSGGETSVAVTIPAAAAG